MTARQYNIIVYAVLLPITVAVWAQVLRTPPPPPAEPVKTYTLVLEPEVRRYTVCPIIGECWVVKGRRAPPVMGSL
jgi:hypothetical protein